MKYTTIFMWGDRIALAIIAALINVVLVDIFSHVADAIGAYYADIEHSCILLYLSVWSALLGAWWLLFYVRAIPQNMFSLQAAMISIRRPPTIAASIFGILLLFLFSRLFPADSHAFLKNVSARDTGTLFAMIFSIPLILLFLKLPHIKKNIQDCSDGVPIQKDNDHSNNSIDVWLSTERPITSSREDFLNNNHIATTIVQEIVEKKIRSLGIIGPYGSGKTSLLNLIDSKLLKTKGRRVLVCRIHGWGLAGDSNASEYILERVIECVGGCVDTLSIYSVPSSYSHILHRSGYSWSGIIGSLVEGTSEPIKTLERLNSLLDDADLGVVISVEDFDRNHVSESACSDMFALLDRIRQHITRIVFIVATSSESRIRIDWPKLCDSVSILPRLSVQDVLPHIIEFEKKCLKEYPDDIYPRLSDDDAHENARIGNIYCVSGRWSILMFSDPTSAYSRVRLLKTPRELKAVLTRSWESWKRLHGEVSLDDIIILHILQVSSPIAYEFIMENISEIRTLREAWPSKQEAKEVARKSINELFYKSLATLSAIDQKDTFDLVCHLVPDIKNVLLDRQPIGFQRIIDNECVDYWRKFLGTSRDKPHDQDILRTISEYVQSNSQDSFNNLNDAITSDDQSLFLFSKFILDGYSPRITLTTDHVCSLMSLSIRHCLESFKCKASSELIAMWIPMLRVASSNGHILPIQWLLTEITRSSTSSLQLMHNLARGWIRDPRYGTLSLPVFEYRGHANDQALNVIYSTVRKCIGALGTDSLANSIDPSKPSLVRDIVGTYWKNDSGIIIEEIDSLRKLITMMMDACDSNPAVITPQLAFLVCTSSGVPSLSENRTTVVPNIVIDSKLISTIFFNLSDRRRLLKLVSTNHRFSELSVEHQEKMVRVQNAAKSELRAYHG